MILFIPSFNAMTVQKPAINVNHVALRLGYTVFLVDQRAYITTSCWEQDSNIVAVRY